MSRRSHVLLLLLTLALCLSSTSAVSGAVATGPTGSEIKFRDKVIGTVELLRYSRRSRRSYPSAPFFNSATRFFLSSRVGQFSKERGRS